VVHGRQVSFRCRRRDGHVVFIAATTLPTLFYLVQKYTDTATAFAAIDQLTAAADIVEVNRATIVAARAMPGHDFEDNVQISCAVATGAGAIVTRDPADFANSPVRVMSPVELLVILRSQ
jgi:predicted nucleic acid-binding protein